MKDLDNGSRARTVFAWAMALLTAASFLVHVLVWRALGAFAAGITAVGVLGMLAGIPTGVLGYMASSGEDERAWAGVFNVLALFAVILSWLALAVLLVLGQLPK